MIAKFCITASMAIMAGLVPVLGHGVMNSPTPYHLHHPDNNGKLLQVDPLNAAAGYTFPCHGQYDNELDGVAEVIAGTTVPVDFVIGADHHGGSCQFGVSYETTDSDKFRDKGSWKVIWTIIGGCPNVNTGEVIYNLPVTGKDLDLRDMIHNCGNDKDKDCIRKFNIPLPKELKNGKAIFAWTWFNNRGNREMYMNCAPIEITGGTDDKDWYNSLPEMFVANIEGECWTGPTGNAGRDDPVSQGILNIPNPGNLGVVLEQPHLRIFDSPDYNCPKATTVPDFKDIRDPSAPLSASASIPTVSTLISASSVPILSLTFPSSSNPATTDTLKPTFTNTSGFVTSPKPTSAGTSSTKPTSTSSPSIKPTTSSSSPPTGSPSTGPPTGSTGCSFGGFSCAGKAEGALVCKDKKTFGLCVKGCAQPQQVAAGMKCENDQYVASN